MDDRPFLVLLDPDTGWTRRVDTYRLATDSPDPTIRAAARAALEHRQKRPGGDSSGQSADRSGQQRPTSPRAGRAGHAGDVNAYLTAGEAAEHLAISVRQLRRLVAVGLPRVQVGPRTYRYRLDDVDRWMETR